MQIKLSCDTKDESALLDEKIKYSDMIVIDTIKFIDNPTLSELYVKLNTKT